MTRSLLFHLLITLPTLNYDLVSAQRGGDRVPEVHPSLITKTCDSASGCIDHHQSVVIDPESRRLTTVDGDENCLNSTSGYFDTDICYDAASCGQSCALQGVDYPAMGVSTQDTTLTLRLFAKGDGEAEKVDPRVYLLDNEQEYAMIKPLNQEISFEVDVSNLPCGTNGAFYFSEMRKLGSINEHNAAGAAYGTGYCDAQCPASQWVDGIANTDGKRGACCNEFDIWEANKFASLMSSHPCNVTSVYRCAGGLCGWDNNYYKGVCVREGCDFNPYRLGTRDFYGPGMNVDTNSPFTVVTQFITNDNTAEGYLTEIRRKFVQNGIEYTNPNTTIASVQGSGLEEEFCNEQKSVFGKPNNHAPLGGIRAMGEAMRRGMVLVMSIWQDENGGMQWLDGTLPATADIDRPGVARGPCPAMSGTLSYLRDNHPEAAVSFSNIRIGPIGSTT